jgi:uroporphyrinogen-III synthase
MRVLVTRPESEARSVAEALTARGHDVLLAPMLRMASRQPPDDFAERLAAAQAILLTSVNGARELAAATKVRGYRIIAVGDATAAAARQAGFTNVTSASGDSQALVKIASAQLTPAAGPLIHAGGTARAGDVAGALRAAGFTVEEVALYDMPAVDALPPDIVRAIQDGRVDAVTFFSARTAQAFVKLAKEAGIALNLARTAAIAISPAALAGAEGVSWRTRIAARAPTQEGVIAALEAMTPASTGLPAMSDKKPTASDKPANGKTDSTAPPDDTGTTPVEATTAAAGTSTPPRRGVGVVGAFVSGLVAAVIVVAGALALLAANSQTVGRWFQPAAKDPGSPPVSQEALARELKPLGDRLTQLETKARALDAVATQAAALKAVQDRLAAHESRLAAVQELAAKVEALPRGDPDAAARVAADLAQARQELSALRSEVAALKSRQETAETTIRTLTDRPPASPGSAPGTPEAPADASRQIAVLMDRLDRLEKREAQVSASLTGAVDSAALARAVGETEARVREQLARNTAEIERSREAASKLADRVAALEKDVAAKLDALRKDLAARDGERRAGDNNRAAAAVGIATRLRQAIDAGGPFAADADLLKPLAAGDPVIAAIHGELAPFAPIGVATRRALAVEFPEIARRVIAADVADDSWGERLLSKLKQLVSIRRVGEDTKGMTPEAILARAEAALEAGDLAKSVNEMKTLKGPVLDPARDWLVRAETHLAAQHIVDRLSLHSIGLLSRSDAK